MNVCYLQNWRNNLDYLAVDKTEENIKTPKVGLNKYLCKQKLKSKIEENKIVSSSYLGSF